MTPVDASLAIVACGAGSVLRYVLAGLRRADAPPWPTLLANVAGTAVLGAAWSLLDDGEIGAGAALVIGTGFAGGLTTFSTLAVETAALWRDSRAKAVAYGVTTVALGIGAGALGWAAAHTLT